MVALGNSAPVDAYKVGPGSSYNPSEMGELTPPKFNMEPENQPLEKEIPIGNPSFSGSMLNFGGVLTL